MVRRCTMWLVVVAVVLMGPLPSRAEEYRLRVAGLYDRAFYTLLGWAGSRREGPVTSDSELVETLDAGQAPAGVFLYGAVDAASPPMVTAFRAARVRPEAPPADEYEHQWSEVRWDGKPGDRTVWVMAPERMYYTRVRDVALQGTGPLVRAIPHRFALSQRLTKAVGIPLEFVRGQEGDPVLWNRHLSAALDLSDGVAVVVGVSSGPFADHVFIVINQVPSSTTYYVALAWERGPHEVEAGGDARENQQ